MDYKVIKSKLLEIQEMMSEVPQEWNIDSEDAYINRRNYMTIKSMIRNILKYL